MAGELIVNTKTILSMLGREFDFSFGLLEDRQRIQKTIYLFQASGQKLGYGFGFHKYGPFSKDLWDDAEEVLHYPKNYEETKKWGFDNSTCSHLNDFKIQFSDVLYNPKNLEILTSVHFFNNIWDYDLDSDSFYKDFKARKRTTFGNRKQITRQEVQDAVYGTKTLIDFRDSHIRLKEIVA